MSISDNIARFRESVPPHVQLVAVSKTKPHKDVMDAYEAGQRTLGENRVQELVDKYEALPKDIEWHMIGHLQRNKVKYIAPFVHLIHGVDSPRLLKEINKQGEKIDRVIPCLLQLHIAREESKFGFSENEVIELLISEAFQSYKYVSILGFMGMATHTDDELIVRKEFEGLKAFKDSTQERFASEQHPMHELSIGMSGDYKIAIDCGSTMIRVGSAIFGSRK